MAGRAVGRSGGADAWTWRPGLRVDASGPDLLVLDPEGGRLVRLTGPAAAVVAGTADLPSDHAADLRDRVTAHLRTLGLLDATGEGAALIAPDRRRVLAAGGAAALGIAVLTLPGAARASSAGRTLSAPANATELDLILARATATATVAHVAGSLDGDAAMRTVDLLDGAVGPATVIRAPVHPEGGVFPRDVVRVGSRAYVVYVTTSSADYPFAFLTPRYAPDVVLRSGVIEVALDDGGATGMAVVRTLTNDAVRGPLWGMYTAIATDGTDVFLAGVVEVTTVDGAVLTPVVERLTIPADPAMPLAIAARLTLDDLGLQPFGFPLALIAAGTDLFLHLQRHPLLEDDGELVAFEDTVSGVVRIARGGETLGPIVGIRVIGLSYPLPAGFSGLSAQPRPLVFAGSLYVADSAAVAYESDGTQSFRLAARVHRLTLSPAWELLPGGGESDPPPPDQTVLLLPPPSASDAPSWPLALERVGSELLVADLAWLHRIPIGDGGVLGQPDVVALAEQVARIGADRGFTWPLQAGLSPLLPASSGSRAFFGLGKGKAGLVELAL